MTNLEVWYCQVEVEPIVDVLRHQAAATGSKAEAHMAATATKLVAKAHTKDSMKALDKLTYVVDGERRIISDPPLIVPVEELFPDVEPTAMVDLFHGVVRQYRQTLPDRPPAPARAVQGEPVARKVVGVGSVGTRAWILLLHGPRRRTSSSSRPRRPRRRCSSASPRRATYANHGARVVAGQRLMQATSDIFLGWQRDQGDRRGAPRLLHPPAPGLEGFGRHRQRHPRGHEGLRRAVRPHPGPGPCPLGRPDRHRGVPRHNATFDKALARFAETYADQNERDYEAFAQACRSGRLHAEEGI